jgi:UDP-2-acetamido-3-amino-2,3-dideoxy-glucuronate N-acetyltransferase
MSGPLLDPWARCDSDQVGDRTRIWAFAHVCAGAVVGEDVNVGEHAYIEGGARIGDRVRVKNAALIWDGVTIEDDAFVGPRVTFTNDRLPRVDPLAPPFRPVPTRICRGATIGAAVTILCGVTVGERAFVGAGSLVLHDVPPYALVVGSPARVIGWVCTCGRRLEARDRCECGRSDHVKPAVEMDLAPAIDLDLRRPHAPAAG